MHHSMLSYEDLKKWLNFNYLNLYTWKVHLQFENANILLPKLHFVQLNDFW